LFLADRPLFLVYSAMRFLSVFLVAAVAAATATVYLPSSRSAQDSSLLNTITSTQNILVVSSSPASSSAPSAPSPISPSESLLKSGRSLPTFVLAVPSSFSAPSRPQMTSDSFPLSQLASAAKTAVVSDGFDKNVVSAFTQKGHSVIRARSTKSKQQLFSALSSALHLDISATSEGFSIEGVQFYLSETDAVFGPVVALLDMTPSSRSLGDMSFVVADLSSGFSSIVSAYGAQSNQAAAVKSVVEATVTYVEDTFGECVLVASDNFVVDGVESLQDIRDVSSFVKNTVPVPKANTTITQIFIWFHVALWSSLAVIVLYTLKLGLDIEKDTLLYRTTALRGQY